MRHGKTDKVQMQWTLSKSESDATLAAWIYNLIYTLSQEEIFAPFLQPDTTWGEKQERVCLDVSLG